MTTIQTSGIRYLGSKQKLTNEILQKAEPLIDHTYTILDVFTGSTRIAQAFRQKGYHVITSDILPASTAYANAYICNPTANRSHLQELINELNSLEGEEDWITKHYCEVDAVNPRDPTKRVNAFTHSNGMKADAIRNKIEQYKLDVWEKMTLITSLINALDVVQNSQGHQRAFFRDFIVPNSLKPLKLFLPPLLGDPTLRVEQQQSELLLFDDNILCNDETFVEQHPVGKHYQGDVLNPEYLQFVKDNTDGKILGYLDPPYTHNAPYNLFYHLWDSIVLWDKPEVGGATNRRVDRIKTNDKRPDLESEWCSRVKARDAFIKLFKALDFVDMFVVSYSDESIIAHDTMIEIFRECQFTNIHETFEKQHNRHSLSKSGTASEDTKTNAKMKNIEYIFTLQR